MVGSQQPANTEAAMIIYDCCCLLRVISLRLDSFLVKNAHGLCLHKGTIPLSKDSHA